MIRPKYRSDYEGEFVITETKWSGGKKTQTREWVPNPIINQHLSHRAACVGSVLSKDRIDYTRLERHKGGLLSSKKLQTYGIAPITQEMRLDFAVTTLQDEINEIKSRNYQEENIVYTTTRMCIQNPGEFYLIPYSPLLSIEALVLYLAAFDGHQEIFMLGYSKDTPSGNNGWVENVNSVISAYTTSTFYCVGVKSNTPEVWFNNSNFKTMDSLEFVSYCDV